MFGRSAGAPAQITAQWSLFAHAGSAGPEECDSALEPPPSLRDIGGNRRGPKGTAGAAAMRDQWPGQGAGADVMKFQGAKTPLFYECVS